MKTNPRFKLLVVLLCAEIGVSSANAANTLATWSNNAGGNAYETPGNWDINQVPTNNTFDVTIGIAAACNLTNGYQIGALNLSVNTAQLNLLPGAVLAFTSDVTNNGAVVVNTTDPLNSTSTLRFDTNVAISGAGSIQLNGIGYNRANISTAYLLTNGANHVIHGRGDIIDTGGVFVNNGTVNADAATGDPLLVYLSNSSSNQNNNLMEATNGGLLSLQGGILDQTGGGTLFASGTNSILGLGGAGSPTIIGGTLNTASNGIIQGISVFLDGCTNSGNIQIPGGDTVAIQANGLTNDGTVLVNSTDPANSTSTLRFDANALLGGNGSVQLDGIGFNRANISTAYLLTNGASHLIHGRGDIIDTGGVFVNNGTVNADAATGDPLLVYLSNSSSNQNNNLMEATNGGLLSLQGGILDQTGGGTLFASGTNSILGLGGAGSPTIIGGTLNTASNGIIQGISAFLDGCTNSGNIQIPGGDTVAIQANGLTNNGTILVNTNADNSTTKIRFDADGTLGGNGSVSLNGIINSFNVADFDCTGHTVINDLNHTIRGNGNIFAAGGTLINNGTLAPGLSPGRLDVNGNLQLNLLSKIFFEVGGTTQVTDYDLLNKTDNGAQKLNGKLKVELINGFTPQSTDTFTILTTQTTLTGHFTNVLSGSRLNTEDGSGSFIVTYNGGNNVVLSNFGAPIPFSHLLNISTRADVETGDDVAIGGFIITGSVAKKVIIRGIGPSLSNSGLQNVLADPTLELHDATGVVATNDNWKDTQQTEIQNSGLAPTNDLESAIVATLDPGAYTAILAGKNSGTGIGLIEVYDLNPSADSHLVNISTRGLVGTGNNVMIGGTIIGPDIGTTKTILVRALGPSLPNSIANRLPDPVLELHDGNGTLFASDDNWKDTQQTDVESTGLAPSNDSESAIVTTILPGNYTAVVHGAGGSTGVGLVEIFDLQTSCVAAPPNMVSWWPGDGNANDIQGGSNGTLQGTAKFASGEVAQAFSFNATSDYVSIPHNDNQNTGAQITIDAWVLIPNAFDSNVVTAPEILSKHTPNLSDGYRFEIGNSPPRGVFNALFLEITTADGFFDLEVPSVITPGSWQQLTATYDGTTIKLFVNGVEVGNKAASGALSPVTADPAIGKCNQTCLRMIDEVELFNRALTPTEIRSIYAAGSNGKCKP